jgi:hypothetical protein
VALEVETLLVVLVDLVISLVTFLVVVVQSQTIEAQTLDTI